MADVGTAPSWIAWSGRNVHVASIAFRPRNQPTKTNRLSNLPARVPHLFDHCDDVKVRVVFSFAPNAKRLAQVGNAGQRRERSYEHLQSSWPSMINDVG
jgi:hypothetical protein